jgi:transcription elongation GreA/GreB family factor
MKDSDIKSQLYAACSDYVNNRLMQVETNIRSMQNDLLSETKSSAGDKHETGRAMIHLEIEKLAVQLSQIRKEKELLQKITISKRSDQIKMGSLVLTDNGKYFLSISAGEIRLDEETYYAVSGSSPVGKILLGKTSGNSIQLRKQTIRILDVL